MISTLLYTATTKYKAIVLLLIALIAAAPLHLSAQTIPVGDFRDTQFRLLQLMSDSTAEISFMNRPVSHSSYQKTVQNAGTSAAWWAQPLQSPSIELSDDFTLGFYEPRLAGTYNNELPYGENNGAAWYGRGMNTEFQGGFHLTSHFLDINFRPHIIYQQNKKFRVPRFVPVERDGDIRYVAEGTLPEDTLAQRIDRPYRFGPDSYSTYDWGHSSVRFHAQGLELGLSSEPLWWGPGVQYALTMSNNAPGVPHAFLGTRAPFELPWNIGHLQLKWIWGWPRDSGYFDLGKRYQRKRFMNGLNIVYSPSFLPNFHVGTSRIIHQYIPDEGLKAADYFAIFRSFPNPEEKVLDGFRDASHYQEKNALSSVFFRWVLPESDAEFYGEFYKEDHNWNFRDFLMEPQHGRAYTLGAQKILQSSWIDFVKVNAEINSLIPPRVDDVRPQTYYYTHKKVKQGHTNRGQVLGAAIGPGSSSQYIGIDGYFKNGKVGIFAQRMVENDHLHFEFNQRWYPLGGFKDQYRHQVKLNIGLNGKYRISNLLLGASMVWNKNYNYGRFNYGRLPISWEGRYKDDLINMQYQLSVQYLFQ
ncbi:capsule assembly Wzi family protein [Fodinibius sediminis]|uniref:capsule assembly Wzi family protein n=1 Tax=Fodinibius sediminis TaxID=1214077 RepID=UPI00163D689A|nr:capsule assembly Wzi family protein [Fodinibius sediminis]